MVDKIKIAAVQMDPLIMEIESNLDRILDQSRVAAANKADLIVFPECALSGYVYSSREEAIDIAHWNSRVVQSIGRCFCVELQGRLIWQLANLIGLGDTDDFGGTGYPFEL